MKLFKIIGLILVLSPAGQAFGVDQETLGRLHENDPSLTTLSLGGNQIGPEGAAALADAKKVRLEKRLSLKSMCKQWLVDGNVDVNSYLNKN